MADRLPAGSEKNLFETIGTMIERKNEIGSVIAIVERKTNGRKIHIATEIGREIEGRNTNGAVEDTIIRDTTIMRIGSLREIMIKSGNIRRSIIERTGKRGTGIERETGRRRGKGSTKRRVTGRKTGSVRWRENGVIQSMRRRRTRVPMLRR
jgi:hypothetical protein